MIWCRPRPGLRRIMVLMPATRIRATNIPGLGADDGQVWWASRVDIAPWHQQLQDPAERQRRERYHFAADRDRFTLGVALSRLILGAHLKTAPANVLIDRTCARCGETHG